MTMTVKRHKPRINVTIDQDQFDCLEEYSAVTGASMSALIRQMLKEIQPSIERTTQAMKLAKSNDPRALELMRTLIDETNQNAQKCMQEIETAKAGTKTQAKCEICGKPAELGDLCHSCEDRAISEFKIKQTKQKKPRKSQG